MDRWAMGVWATVLVCGVYGGVDGGGGIVAAGKGRELRVVVMSRILKLVRSDIGSMRRDKWVIGRRGCIAQLKDILQ